MSWLEDLEVNLEENVDEKMEEREGFKGVDAGLYDVVIVQAYFRKTDSGATQFEISMETKNEDKIHWSTNMVSGDDKGNKPNKYSPYDIIKIMKVCEMDYKTEKAEPVTLEHKGKPIKAEAFKAMSGKKLQVAVRYEEKPGWTNKTLIHRWFKADGSNYEGKKDNDKGESYTGLARDYVQDNPLKLAKVAATKKATSKSDEAAKKSW